MPITRSHDSLRVSDDRTIDELARLYRNAFVVSSVRKLSESEAADAWAEFGAEDNCRPKAAIAGQTIFVFLYASLNEPPVVVVAIATGTPLSATAASFAKDLSKIFNQDVLLCPHVQQSLELWATLGETRFSRAMARYPEFNTIKVAGWIRLFEKSSTLTYEGSHPTTSVLISRKPSETKKALGTAFLPNTCALSLQDALLHEKWVRAVIEGRRVGLFCSQRTEHVTGFVSLPDLDAADRHLYAPHESFLSIRGALQPRDICMVSAPHGDLFVMCGDGVVFHRSQGEWRLDNYDSVHEILLRSHRKETVVDVLRLALDLSFERSGALLFLPDDDAPLTKIVSDHSAPTANRHLRTSVRGMRLSRSGQRQVIAAAASTDGAVVIDKNGAIVDIACLITPPSDLQLRHHRVDRRSFPGARSAATWNASAWGTAIKISEDGPISIYRHCVELATIG